jgi:hypothetical protein
MLKCVTLIIVKLKQSKVPVLNSITLDYRVSKAVQCCELSFVRCTQTCYIQQKQHRYTINLLAPEFYI